MVVQICDRCNQAYTIEDHAGDYVHICTSGNPTLDNEDVVVVGDWEDYTGSAQIPDGSVPFQGAANKLWGTRAEIEGNVTQTLTRRGRSIQTHRTRQHLQYKEDEGGIN